jgi:DNA topoisomerase-1
LEKLVIVESPTKARTIGRMLGNDYRITASMGHVRDLPEHSFGVDIEHGFTPQYTENSRSGKIIKELKSLAKNASEIYLAPDPDREGEAIAWHLK